MPCSSPDGNGKAKHNPKSSPTNVGKKWVAPPTSPVARVTDQKPDRGVEAVLETILPCSPGPLAIVPGVVVGSECLVATMSEAGQGRRVSSEGRHRTSISWAEGTPSKTSLISDVEEPGQRSDQLTPKASNSREKSNVAPLSQVEQEGRVGSNRRRHPSVPSAEGVLAGKAFVPGAKATDIVARGLRTGSPKTRKSGAPPVPRVRQKGRASSKEHGRSPIQCVEDLANKEAFLSGAEKVATLPRRLKSQTSKDGETSGVAPFSQAAQECSVSSIVHRRSSIQWVEDIASGGKPLSEVQKPKNPLVQVNTGPSYAEHDDGMATTSEVGQRGLNSSTRRGRTSLPWAEENATGGKPPSDSESPDASTTKSIEGQQQLEANLSETVGFRASRTKNEDNEHRVSISWAEDVKISANTPPP